MCKQHSSLLQYKIKIKQKNQQNKEIKLLQKRSVYLTLYDVTPTKLHHLKEGEIYQSLPQAEILLSHFLIL